MLQEEVQLWVASRVYGDFKQWHEDVLQHLLEVAELFLGVVDITVEEENVVISHIVKNCAGV